MVNQWENFKKELSSLLNKSQEDSSVGNPQLYKEVLEKVSKVDEKSPEQWAALEQNLIDLMSKYKNEENVQSTQTVFNILKTMSFIRKGLRPSGVSAS